MIKHFFILLLPIFCYSQGKNNDSLLFCNKVVGLTNSIGVIELRNDHLPNIDCYSILDLKDNTLIKFSAQKDYFIYNEQESKFSKFIISDTSKYFNPFNYYIEPTFIQFECKSEEQGYYLVYLNKERTNIGKIIKDTLKFKLINWYDYYRENYPIIDTNSIIKSNLDDKLNLSPNIDEVCVYRITKIKDEWMELRSIKEVSESCTYNRLWVKWIDNNKIILKLALDL
ncbi:MAG: hypothetical protein H6Q15_1240 [Bacteroidetes bacterium]|nr:hypothetical protein [Bacteroidota bacterium]